MKFKKTFLIFLVLLCVVSLGLASVSAASDTASDDASQSAMDDNAIDEGFLEETDDAVSGTVESGADDSISDTESGTDDAVSGSAETDVDNSISDSESGTDDNDDKSLGASTLKDGETSIYVSTTGNDSNDGSSEENAVATVGKAYELAGSGSTINVGAGTFVVNNILISKNITIKGNEAGSTIFDGNASSDLNMFTVNSLYTLNLLNLNFINSGTAEDGRFINVKEKGKLNIEGSRFENINFDSEAPILLAKNGSSTTIKDSSFNNITCTRDYTLMYFDGGNLSVERSNFTNINGKYNSNWYGALGFRSYASAYISECQFINVSGGDGSAIYFMSNSYSTLTITKSIFINNKNYRGAIFINNPASANVNYNLFIDNQAGGSDARDIYMNNRNANLNASYNLWSCNGKPGSKEITNPSKVSVWTVLELSSSVDTAYIGDNAIIYLKYKAENATETVSLDEAMPEYVFDLSASSGSIEPGAVIVANNEGSATFTPEDEGFIIISTNPGSVEFELRVLNPSKMLVVSSAGNDDTGAGTLDNPYATIAKALSQVTETRNVVYILKSENAYKEHDLAVSSDVIIKCEDSTVTIDGENAGRIFIVTGTLAIEDLKLINGQSSENGGAIYVDGGNLTLTNATIFNSAALNGGAIYVDGGNLTLMGANISDSTATNGGAIGAGPGSTLVISSSLFSGNEATNGGAIYIDSANEQAISGNFFNSNVADKGQAIYIKDASVSLSENEMIELETIYLESGNVNNILTFLENKTLSADLGEILTLTATLTDDMGNVIRGGSVIFTANGENIGTADLSGNDPLGIIYHAPTALGDVVISGSYSLSGVGTVKNGIVHPAVPHWFIEGGRGYELLSQAIDAAHDGDVIYGEAGRYIVNGLSISKRVTIKSNESGSIVLDGDKNRIFEVESEGALTLLNLVLCNGGTFGAGGFCTIDGTGTINLINSTVKDLRTDAAGAVIYLYSSGKVNIEGSHFENITTSSSAGLIHAIRDHPVITIKDSSVNNVNTTSSWGCALIDMQGDLRIERSNFTNVNGRYTQYGYGAISSTLPSNYYISECQFINVTGGTGSSIYFYNSGNLTITKSVFMNNRNFVGSIYINDLSASANITYNLFINNEANIINNARDVYIENVGNINASYNFWGDNNKPTASQISNKADISCWTIVELSSRNNNVYLGTHPIIDVKFVGTDGSEIMHLHDSMPEYGFDLSASSGSIEPGAVRIVDNIATASYTPSTVGTVSITANPSAAELVFDVKDSAVLLVVSPTGNDDTGTGTMENPYATIAKALSQVTESRNVIYLRAGDAYKEHDLTVDGNVFIQGEDNTVTIDGENAGRIFIVTGTATIEDLILINGQIFDVGGAIYVNGGNLTLIGTNISNSVAESGGAIGAGSGSSLTIYNSFFSGNEATIGGAIYIDSVNEQIISENTFNANVANKGQAIYIKDASVRLSENAMTEFETIFLESGSVNSILTFLSNSTIYKDFGEMVDLTATLTDDMGNVIRGGSVTFTANGADVGSVLLRGDNPLQISYQVPSVTEDDVIISGSYSYDNGGTVLNGTIHPPICYWFIEGGDGYETLDQAIQAANAGDVISGKPGTYIVNGITISKDITIKANDTGAIVLDGDRLDMFIVDSQITLTLLNLDLTKGGIDGGGFVDIHGGSLNLTNCTLRDLQSSRRGGAISVNPAGSVYIEGCHFENISSTEYTTIIYTPSDETSIITIKDSSFNNINSSKGHTLMEIHGDLTIERSNFTNIIGSFGEINRGAISLPGYDNTAFISECQFINISGGTGSSIAIENGTLTVVKSVFMNNKNTMGTIYIGVSNSSNINYNLFIDNDCISSYEGKDLFISNMYSNVNASYNFWGNNSQPTLNEITVVEDAAYWTIVQLSIDNQNVLLGNNPTVYAKFIATNGIEDIPLDVMMPEYSFNLSASSGSIEPGTVSIVNNIASASYTPSTTGNVILTANPGPGELELYVIDPNGLIAVSATGNDDTGTGTMENPYATIAKALSQVTESRNIILLLKSENPYKVHDLTVSGNVIIKGDDETVTIDGENAGHIFIVTGTATLRSLKLINGQSDNGGAIYVDGGNLTLIDVNLQHSEASNGGAIYLADGNLNVTNSAFAYNTATKGEAIYIENGNLTLSGNTMEDNQTIYLAGGTVNSLLKFLDNATIKAEFGEEITLTATLTDDMGNVIRGGILTFTANGVNVGTVDLSGNDPLEITYTIPMTASGNITISGSYSQARDENVVNGTIYPTFFNWFIEGGDRYETLLDAILASQDGDVIYGKPGTYDVSKVSFRRNITIKANESGSIILNGNGKTIFLTKGNVVLENLIFINGPTNVNGGFITVEADTLTIRNCVFKDTQATSGQGTGIYVSYGSAGLVVENSLFDNITAYDGLINCKSSSARLTISKTNFTNIKVLQHGVFYLYDGRIDLTESKLVNITGADGAIAYFWGLNNNFITKCIFDNVTSTGTGIFHSQYKTANLSYNVFSRINGLIYSSSAGDPITADYNYWGTSDPRSFVNANTVLNNWVIMTVSPDSPTCIVGEPLELTIDFKHIISTSGEIGDLGDLLPAEFTVYATSPNGTVSPAEITTTDSEAKLVFTSVLNGKNIVNINWGSETIPVIINVIKPTAIQLQRLIDATPKGGVLDLRDEEYVNVSGINITKDITIIGDNLTIITAGDGTPVFNIASTLSNVTISGIEFVANNGDVLIKANAENATDPLAIENPAIKISNNKVTKANDDVVASSVTLFKLESERAVLAPSNPITIEGNTVPEGAKTFDFEISGLSDGSGINIPTGGNINTNGSTNGTGGNGSTNGTGGNGTAPVVTVATKIVSKNIKTTTVNTKINGKKAGKNFSITLKDSKGKVLAGKQVLISINGKIYKRTTNSKGVATVKVALAKKGTYPIVVSFLGDNKYKGSFAVAKVVVSPQKVKLTVAKKTYKASKKTKYLYATLKATNKKAIKGKKLVFIVNGKKYTAKTNAKGIAKVKVKLSKKRTYKFTVKFAGDNTFYKISKKGKVVIK